MLLTAGTRCTQHALPCGLLVTRASDPGTSVMGVRRCAHPEFAQVCTVAGPQANRPPAMRDAVGPGRRRSTEGIEQRDQLRHRHDGLSCGAPNLLREAAYWGFHSTCLEAKGAGAIAEAASLVRGDIAPLSEVAFCTLLRRLLCCGRDDHTKRNVRHVPMGRPVHWHAALPQRNSWTTWISPTM